MSLGKMSMSDTLSKLRIKVLADLYNIVRLDTEQWGDVVSDPSLSPRMSSPFMIFRSEQDFLLLLDDADVAGIKARFSVEIESGIRILEIRSEDGLRSGSGFTSASSLLTLSGFGVRCLSSWDADFLLVKQEDLAQILKVLSPHVEVLC
jgi:hypothetical protein